MPFRMRIYDLNMSDLIFAFPYNICLVRSDYLELLVQSGQLFRISDPLRSGHHYDLVQCNCRLSTAIWSSAIVDYQLGKHATALIAIECTKRQFLSTEPCACP